MCSAEGPSGRATLGATLGIEPTNRLRVRTTLLWRSWVETFDGIGLERQSSAVLTLDVGGALGPKKQDRRESVAVGGAE